MAQRTSKHAPDRRHPPRSELDPATGQTAKLADLPATAGSGFVLSSDGRRALQVAYPEGTEPAVPRSDLIVVDLAGDDSGNLTDGSESRNLTEGRFGSVTFAAVWAPIVATR